MIADGNEELLKFLDNASFQLACLLDLDRQQASNGNKKLASGQRLKGGKQNSNNKGKAATRSAISSLKQTSQSHKRGQRTEGGTAANTNRKQHLTQLKQQNRKKNLKSAPSTAENDSDGQLKAEHNNQNISGNLLDHTQQQTTIAIDHDIIRLKLTPTLHDGQPEEEVEPSDLDVRLSLTIADDDELPLDQVNNISPATHLSPLSQFQQARHNQHSQLQHHQHHHHHHHHQQQQHHHQQQHYHYTQNHRDVSLGQSDYHQHHHHMQHDEYTRHESIPNQQVEQPSNPSTGSHHQQLIESDHQERQTNGNCYQHRQAGHHHHHHHHHQHHQHHILDHQPHYHQLDQQHHGHHLYAGETTNDVASSHNPNDAATNIHLLSGSDSMTSLDQVVHQLSPATHQSLEHVNFNVPLYSHHSYYNNQADQLESFQHLSDDPYNTPAPTAVSDPTPTSNNTSSTNEGEPNNNGQINILRLQPPTHNHHRHHSEQAQQHHITQHHQIQHNTNNSNNNNRNEQTMESSVHESNYSQMSLNPHQQQHHLASNNHHYNSHHIMPIMMNGLVESGGVIIQDINLASASWSSPEDLYSI